MTPRVWHMIPCFGTVGAGGDLGKAYNDYMALVPETDWALLTDHDIAFCCDGWQELLVQAIAENPDGALFTAKTNRLRQRRSKWQMHGDCWCHDIVSMRRAGEDLAARYGAAVRDVTTSEQRGGKRPASGVFLCIEKRAWTQMGGIEAGWAERDWAVHEGVERIGRRVYLLEGVLVYHWFRGRGAEV